MRSAAYTPPPIALLWKRNHCKLSDKRCNKMAKVTKEVGKKLHRLVIALFSKLADCDHLLCLVCSSQNARHVPRPELYDGRRRQHLMGE